MKKVIPVIAVFLAFKPAHADSENSAREKAEKMLDAMGGAAIWKEVRSVHNTAINHHPESRLPYIQEYWYDTFEPRHHVTITNHDFDRVRGYTRNGGCSSVEGVSKPFSEERMKNELQSWSRSVYRKLFLLASDPENLKLTSGADGSVHFEYKGEFIGWMTIGTDGTPKRHSGTPSAETYTDFFPLIKFGSVSWPRGGQDNDGWDFEMLSLEISSEEMPKTLADPCSNK